MSELSAEQQEARPILELEAKSRDTLTRTRAKYFLAALDALEAAKAERDEAYGRVADYALREAGREREGAMKKNLTDREIVLLYSQWSEECYAAGFMEPEPGLKQFVAWLEQEQPFEDYELELVRQYRALEPYD